VKPLDSISIVLPCRNQADHIARIVPAYATALEATGMPFELVVVPNASTDRTQQVVEELGKADPRIRVVANPLGGWGLSVRTGLDAARGTILSYTNTARTDPATLPEYFRRYCEQPGRLVKASRRARNAPMREIGSFLYNLEGRILFGLRCSDINGTPKIFAGDFYRSVKLTTTGDLLDLELMHQAHRKGLEVCEIPVEGFKRHGGKSSTTFRSAWNMYMGALQLRLKRSA
jgi:glycosyltransferase involved in cell wall biosynthesis